MVKRDTRQLIADAFINAVKQTSLSKVRIADLIEQLNINRNTYYYHFAGKHETAIWIFRQALASELERLLPPDQLVNGPLGKHSDKTLPYYTHVEIGARTLDASAFMQALFTTVRSDADFFRKLFCTQEPEFMGCVEQLYQPALANDIDFILDGRYMPVETKCMIVTMSARHIVSSIEFFLQNPSLQDGLMNARVNPFANALQESLFNLIQAHPINRYSQHQKTLRPSE